MSEGFLMLREEEVREMVDRVFTQRATALRAQRVFTHLLGVAPKHVSYACDGVEVKPHHVLVGRYRLAKKLNCTPDEVKYILKRLRQAGELGIESNHKYSDIWIIHYWKYVAGSPKDSLPSIGLNPNNNGGCGEVVNTGFPEKPVIAYPISTAKPTMTGVSGDDDEKIPTHLYVYSSASENEVKDADISVADRAAQWPVQGPDQDTRDVAAAFGQAELAERDNPFPPLWEVLSEEDIQEHNARLDAEEAESGDSEES